MLSAVSYRVRNIFGSPPASAVPRKRALEEESEEEEVLGDNEGEPARKKSRPLIDNEETPLARSYIWNFRKFISGSVTGMYSWMSHLTSLSASSEGIGNSTETVVHKMRINMTESTNLSKREEGKAEGTIVIREPTEDSCPITSGIKPPDVVTDDEVQFLGTSPRHGQNDLPTKRPALSRRPTATEISEPSLCPTISNFRFKPTINPVAPDTTPDITARHSTKEPSSSFLKNSLAGRKVYTNPKKSGFLTKNPIKSLHDRYFGIQKKKPMLSPFSSGRGISCAQESFRFEDKMRYRQLLQQYTDSLISPSSHVRRVSPSSFSTSNSCSITSLSPVGMVTKSRLNSTWTKEKRQQLEVTLNNLSSSGEPLADDTTSRLEESTSQKKTANIPVVDLEKSESNSSIMSAKDSETESVIFMGEVTKPTSQRNSLEERLLESPVYNSDWLKDLREKYEVRAKTNDTEVEILAEIQKKFEERRKSCQTSLEDRITRRMRYLDLTFPSKVEEIQVEVEKEAEKEFFQLTSDMEDMIDDALEKTPASEVLVDKFSIKITRRDIATLAGLNWLNDEVINFYMNLLMERGKKDSYPSVYAFNTFFYPKLVKNGYRSVQKWTKKVDVFSYDILLVPVHLGMHWCLATIDFQNKSVQYYDSMLGNNDRCLEALLKYLHSEHMDKKHSNYISSNWTLENVKDIPQQMNGSDCGMFACKFAEYLSRRACLTFKQQHMPYFRRRMVYEIVTATLL